MQTKRGGPRAGLADRGDCLDAAIASVLEVPIERARIPWSKDEHWWDSAQRAVRALGHVLVVADVQVWPGGHWLAVVPSQNIPGETHSIVMYDGQVAHDPALGKRYEIGTSIEDLDLRGAYVLVPLTYQAVAA